MSPIYGKAAGAKSVINPPAIKAKLKGIIIFKSMLYPYPE